MFKSRRNPYKKNRQRFHPVFWLLAIPVSLILLELLTRLIVGVIGKNAELASYEGEDTKVTTYRLKFLDQNQHPYDGLPNRGRLIAKRRLSVGYQLAGEQKSVFWQINKQGFRAQQPVIQTKPQDEIRIFVLGGSTAFGQMSLNNQTTFASKLEVLLNQRVAQQKASPDKFRPDPLPVYRPERLQALTLPIPIRLGQYRVINAAVPGYTSGNELAQLALQILTYQPDLIVVLNGYSDLMLPSTQNEIDIPHAQAFMSNAPGHFWAYITQEMNQWITQSYLVKASQKWVLHPHTSVNQLSLPTNQAGIPLEQLLPKDSTELWRRTQRYNTHLMQMAQLTSLAQIPIIMAIQPEITSLDQNKRSPQEAAILGELSPLYKKGIKVGYEEFTGVTKKVQKAFPQNVTTLNLYNLYQKFPSQAFYDTIHLTDEANTVLADKLYNVILDLPQLQPPVNKKKEQ